MARNAGAGDRDHYRGGSSADDLRSWPGSRPVLAIGLGVLYRRKTAPVALALYGLYALVVVVFAAVMSRMGAA